MAKPKNPITDVADLTVDLFDKVASPASRAGSSVERIAKMAREELSANVIALQMTENSHNGYTYTAKDVETITNFYEDCETKVLVTKKEATALINDQRGSNSRPGKELLEPQT